MNDIIGNLKNICSNFIEWFKENKEWKVIGSSFALGIITFSSWASLVLAALCVGVLYFINKPMCTTVLGFINIDVSKYVKNCIVGLVLASILLLIF